MVPALGWLTIGALLVGVAAYNYPLTKIPFDAYERETGLLASISTSRVGVHILLREPSNGCTYLYPWSHGRGAVLEKILAGSVGKPVTLLHSRSSRRDDRDLVFGVSIDGHEFRKPAESTEAYRITMLGILALSVAVLGYGLIRVRRAWLEP